MKEFAAFRKEEREPEALPTTGSNPVPCLSKRNPDLSVRAGGVICKRRIQNRF